MLNIVMYLDVFCFWYHVIQNQFKTVDWKKTWLTDIWYHVVQNDSKTTQIFYSDYTYFWYHVIYNDSKTV